LGVYIATCKMFIVQLFMKCSSFIGGIKVKVSPPSRRKAWLSFSSARRRANFGNPNVRVYLIIDTCLVRTLTN